MLDLFRLAECLYRIPGCLRSMTQAAIVVKEQEECQIYLYAALEIYNGLHTDITLKNIPPCDAWQDFFFVPYHVPVL
jgi:hypothetical protein